MWKSAVGHNVKVEEKDGDDWETDPDFVNDISEQDQRWGAKTVEGSGRPQHINIHDLRANVSKDHEVLKKKEMEEGSKASYGYGGKFGVQKDRMDKSALGNEYVAVVAKHSSQTDAAKGFGGKYGVQKDRIDKSALSYDYKGEVEKHASQKDYAKGFGGKYGVQKDRQDQAAHGWDHKEEVKLHESQTDHAKGFGGRYGVQQDRMDKSAASFTEMEGPTSSYQKTTPVEAASSSARSLKSRFEDMARASDEDNRKRAEEERERRQARERMEQEAVRRKQQVEHENETQVPEPERAEPIPPIPQRRGQKLVEKPEPEPEPEPDPEPEPEQEEAQIYDNPDSYHEEQNMDDYENLSECSHQPEPKEHLEDQGDYEKLLPIPRMKAETANSDAENVYDIADAGVTAVALYDYQGEGDDEISFDPGDKITSIEMIDEGWWQGHCNGKFGLFPANYVQLSK